MKLKNLVMFMVMFLVMMGGYAFAEVSKIKVFDMNHDGVVNEKDTFEKVHENGFFETAELTNTQVNAALLGGFDANADGKLQITEYSTYLNATFPGTQIVTLFNPLKETITATFIDKNHNSYIDVDETYTYRFSSGKKEYGAVKQSLLTDITAKGFDSNNLITTIELLNYLNSLKQYNWRIYLSNVAATVNYNRYTLITDKDSNQIVNIGEKFVHCTLGLDGQITEKESGIITKDHIDQIINGGFDVNGDLQVQKSEFEASTLALVGKTCLLTFVPEVIDTRGYWPISIGNLWEYTNYLDPTKMSWTQIVAGHLLGRNPDAFFSKNHKDTYWGNGSDMGYRMGLYWAARTSDSLDLPLLAASSSSSYTDYFDGNPDAIVYWTGSDPVINKKKYADYWNVKTIAKDGNIPYSVFPTLLNVDSFTVDSIQGQYHINYDWPAGTTVTQKEEGHPWKIKYEWVYLKTKIGYEGPALHLMCDELFAVPSIYEDWYFVENYGMIKIEQYLEGSRTNRLVRIDASKVFLN